MSIEKSDSQDLTDQVMRLICKGSKEFGHCGVTTSEATGDGSYTITRLNITDCKIGGCWKIGTHGNK